MAVPQSLHDGHKVLGEENYCSGYMDPYGKWNNGFPCPFIDDDEPVFCCGTDSFKYCCVKPKLPASPPMPQLALLLGVAFGILVAVIIVTIVSCFHCSCCLLYKKRQPSSRGSVYQMQCPSTASGVANMYSFSGTTTPLDTPRSNSRGSSSSRSRITTESGPSTISYGPYDIGDIRNRTDIIAHAHTHEQPPTYSTVHNSRPGSIAFSDRSASTMSDITVRENVFHNHHQDRSNRVTHLEPPPPYSAPHSTLVAVRTSSAFGGQPTPVPEPHTPPSMHTHTRNMAPVHQSEIQGGNNGHGVSNQLRTFPQTSTATTASSSAAMAALAAVARLPTIRITNHNQSTNTMPLTQNHRNHQPTQTNNNNNHYSNLPNPFQEGYSNNSYGLPQSLNLITTTAQRPCSSAHIINAHQQGIDDRRLYSATKF